MASKSENPDIREMQIEMKGFEKTLSEVRADVKTLIDRHDQYLLLQQEVNTLKNAVDEVKKRKNFQAIIAPMIASIITGVVVFLSISFFNNLQPDTQSSTTTTTQTQDK